MHRLRVKTSHTLLFVLCGCGGPLSHTTSETASLTHATSTSPSTTAEVTSSHVELPIEQVNQAILSIMLTEESVVDLVVESADDSSEKHLITSPSALEHTIPIFGLLADTEYHYSAQSIGEEVGNGSFTTSSLPPDLPEMTLTVGDSTVSDDYTIFNWGVVEDLTFVEEQRLIIVDSSGQVRWYSPNLPDRYIDLGFALLDPETIFISGGGGGSFYAEPKNTLPIVMTLHGDVLAQADLSDDSCYHHHATQSNANELMALRSVYNTTAKDDIIGFELVSFNQDLTAETWSWSSQVGINSGQLTPDLSLNDPFHANWFTEAGDGIMVSLFYNQSVIKVDRATGNIDWTMGVGGDFSLLESDGSPADDSRWFQGIHGANFSNNELLVYDNIHGDVGEEHSRALKLLINEEDKTATILSEYTEPNWIEPIFGSVADLGDDIVLIAMGHCDICAMLGGVSRDEPHLSQLVRVNMVTGETDWTLSFKDPVDALYAADVIKGCDIFTNSLYCPDLLSHR